MLEDIPIFGSDAGIRLLNCRLKLHRVPNEIAVAGLQRQLSTFWRRGWYACLMYSDGRGVLRGDDRKAKRPSREQGERLIDVCVKVNREIHHDGHWVGVWSRDRLGLLWRDADGDAQFTIEFEEPWVRIRGWAATEFSARAEAAYQEWVERMRAVDRRSDETIKAAQGQQSRSPLSPSH